MVNLGAFALLAMAHSVLMPRLLNLVRLSKLIPVRATFLSKLGHQTWCPVLVEATYHLNRPRINLTVVYILLLTLKTRSNSNL